MELNVKETIVNLLGVREASNSEKYLGLPMMVGRKKNWVFVNFVDRFRKRINGWSAQYLSMGSKEVFIKSILQAMSVYAMQCFALLKQLGRIMNKFRWSNSKTAKDILSAKVGFYPSFS
ncbi:hypothetical protein J1N35_044328 [Gossypium stocksii]|uniref:Reverse transcriptase n=1 Tax=Gossypium stocksii TaxID=47602 RepID=A0A9D3U918_9ROSI|nr:hypothetical protein J1N35_044328 [Gossypium stocksii]